jgi:hypothetical protein
MEFKIARGDFKEVGDQVLSDISGSKYKVMSPEEGRYVDNINALKERRAGVDLAIEDAASGLKMKKTPIIDSKKFTEDVAAKLAETDRLLLDFDPTDFSAAQAPEFEFDINQGNRPRSILDNVDPIDIEIDDSNVVDNPTSRLFKNELEEETSSVFKRELEEETENFFDITNRSTWRRAGWSARYTL